MVVVELVRELLPHVPVLFLETGYHFADVYTYRDEMTAKYGLNLVNVMPEKTVAEQESQFGKLFQIAPDQCCKLRKVGPLFRALENYDVWFTGLQPGAVADARQPRGLDVFPLPSGRKIPKISPLATGQTETYGPFQRAQYSVLASLRQGLHQHRLRPCTALPLDPENLRSGRWAGRKARMRHSHR